MTSAELLVDAFGRIRQVVHRVVAGLTPEQLAFRAVCPASDDVSDIFQPTGSLLVTAVGREQWLTCGDSAATVAACGSGGAGWPGYSASKACQQNEKAQHTSVQCRRIARRFLTWKSAQPSSSQPIWSVAGQRLEDPFGLDNGPAEAAERLLAARRRGDGGGKAVLGGVVDDCADPPDPAAGGLELGESICASSLAGSRRRSIGCVGTRNAGMAVGHGVGCHREVR
jgi:hypothetical protein